MQLVAPSSGWYVPGVQLSHVALPVTAAYVPGAHGVASIEPVVQWLPSGHGVHSEGALSPVELEYDPARHGSGAAAPSAQ